MHPSTLPARLRHHAPVRRGCLRHGCLRGPAASPGHLRRLLASERGDVPGWVLVTLMTAGLVVALWAVAGPALTQVFTDAIAKVTGAI